MVLRCGIMMCYVVIYGDVLCRMLECGGRRCRVALIRGVWCGGVVVWMRGVGLCVVWC